MLKISVVFVLLYFCEGHVFFSDDVSDNVLVIFVDYFSSCPNTKLLYVFLGLQTL